VGPKARVLALSAEQTARNALGAYDLPEARLRVIRTTNNDVFEVTGRGAPYALRVHRPDYRSPAQVRSELLFLSFVADELRITRIDVPRPVATGNGDLARRGRLGTIRRVLTWVDGRELKPTRGLGRRSSALLGEGLARLHDAAARFEPEPGFELPTWNADRMLTEASPFRPGPLDTVLPPEALELLGELDERTRAVFAELDRIPDTQGIIHSDLVLVNCRAREDRPRRRPLRRLSRLGRAGLPGPALTPATLRPVTRFYHVTT